MRAEAALADRRREVRLAGRAWRRAGAIDDATLVAIDAAYPDDRARLGPAFRTLAFVFGLLALNAFFGVIGLASGGGHEFGVACLFFAVVLAAATEVLVGPLKRADSGIESATALLAVVYALVGFGFLFDRALGSEAVFLLLLLAIAAVLATAGSMRWGSPLLAVVATTAAFLFLARLPAARLLWVTVAVVAAPLLQRGSESAALAPSHRRSLQLTLLMAIGALYLATNLVSWDRGWLEWLADGQGTSAAARPPLRPLLALATALVPLAVLAFGIVTRRALLLNLGVVLGVVSLVTLRFYVHVAPVWVVLVVAGTASLLAVLGLRRWLRSAEAGERGGFTAAPLFEDADRRRSAEIIGALVAFGPAARPQAQPAGLKPGGGQYGGGGATSDF